MASSQRVSAGSEMQRLKSMAQLFRQQKPLPIAADFHKRASVLVCLFQGKNGELRVFLTKRASTLSSYSGEVSLPGGKVEKDDESYIETALREANEEIGLDPRDVTVVAILEPFIAKSDVLVVPVIGFLSGENEFTPSPNTAEVESVFHAPFEMFLKGEKMRGEEGEWKGEKFICNYFDFEDENGNKHVIWALTAVILITSASLVYQRPPDFPEHRLKDWTVDPLKLSSAL